VADNGPGVPPQAVANLFEPFFRVRSRLETGHHGAGLGLSIAQASMIAHGGGVAARNGAQGGLAISLWLPLEESANAALAARLADRAAA
jgi:signal transduction histidine kinase